MFLTLLKDFRQVVHHKMNTTAHNDIGWFPGASTYLIALNFFDMIV